MPGQTITARSIVRALGLAALAGAVSGFVAGGIGGRLFMFLLAQLNPEEHGLPTDDGFEMGQFTVSGTLNLLGVTTVIGIVGGVLFLALRGLRFGPRWFRILSMPVGATMVAGAGLVHSDGVDFSLLEPVGLAVAMTLAVPFFYTLMVAWLADRWLGTDPWVWSRLPAAVPWIARTALVALAVFMFVDLVSTIDEILHPFEFD